MYATEHARTRWAMLYPGTAPTLEGTFPVPSGVVAGLTQRCLESCQDEYRATPDCQGLLVLKDNAVIITVLRLGEREAHFLRRHYGPKQESDQEVKQESDPESKRSLREKLMGELRDLTGGRISGTPCAREMVQHLLQGLSNRSYTWWGRPDDLPQRLTFTPLNGSQVQYTRQGNLWRLESIPEAA